MPRHGAGTRTRVETSGAFDAGKAANAHQRDCKMSRNHAVSGVSDIKGAGGDRLGLSNVGR